MFRTKSSEDGHLTVYSIIAYFFLYIELHCHDKTSYNYSNCEQYVILILYKLTFTADFREIYLIEIYIVNALLHISIFIDYPRTKYIYSSPNTLYTAKCYAKLKLLFFMAHNPQID